MMFPKFIVYLAVAVSPLVAYQFDPMNNSWKPSPGQKHGRHQSSSFTAASYVDAPPVVPAVIGIDFPKSNEDDIVRHQYATGWMGNQQSNTDPSFVRKESLVRIEYNKRTGEVALDDQDGVVTKEEYERLIKVIKSASEESMESNVQKNQYQSRDDLGVAIGTTQFIDVDDFDLTDIIDTQGEEEVVSSSSSSNTNTVISNGDDKGNEEHHETPQYDYKGYYQQQIVDETQPQQEFEPQFSSYSVPQPTSGTHYYYNHHQKQHNYQHVAEETASATVTIQEQQEHYNCFLAQEHQPYYYHNQNEGTSPFPPTTTTTSVVPTQAGNSPIADTVGDEVNDHEAVEYVTEEESYYRSSRGFGFSSRRQNFVD